MIERMEWDEFAAQWDWRQGEHVSLIGPTGAGKTTLGLAILPFRRYSVALGTKPKDPTLSALVRAGWSRIRRWRDRPPMPIVNGKMAPVRLILWPTFRRMADAAEHRQVFRDALHDMFAEGSWCLFADEIMYLSNDLRLDAELKLWWRQGRSIGLSLVAATQRPAWVPLELYSQASHLFLWRTTDRRDLERLRDISGPVDSRELMATVQSLDWRAFEVLYVDTKSGRLIITTPPKA